MFTCSGSINLIIIINRSISNIKALSKIANIVIYIPHENTATHSYGNDSLKFFKYS